MCSHVSILFNKMCVCYLQLNEHLERQKLNTAVDHKDLLYQNKTLNEEVESLKQAVLSLQEQLEVAKSVPTEAERLDAILAASRNFEVSAACNRQYNLLNVILVDDFYNVYVHCF